MNAIDILVRLILALLVVLLIVLLVVRTKKVFELKKIKKSKEYDLYKSQLKEKSQIEKQDLGKIINQMDESKLSISAETKQQADLLPSTTEVKRAALKNLALCAILGAISIVLWATGVVSSVIHSEIFKPRNSTAGIEFAVTAMFGVFSLALIGWVIVAALLGFVLLTGKWPRNYNQFLPYLPSMQPDSRLVRWASAKNLLFCILWSLCTYGLSATPLPRLLGELFLNTGHGGIGITGWIIGLFGPFVTLLLFFGWVLVLPFVLISLVTGGWFRFMRRWLPFSPKADSSKKGPPTETSQDENKQG